MASIICVWQNDFLFILFRKFINYMVLMFQLVRKINDLHIYTPYSFYTAFKTF